MACRIKDGTRFGRLGWFWTTFVAVGLVAGFSVRVDAMYVGSGGVPVSEPIASTWSRISEGDLSAGEYLDREWYYVLDQEQYDYLDRGQYNLLGGLSYVLRHPAYPKLFERAVGGGVGFESAGYVGFLGHYDGFDVRRRAEKLSEGIVSPGSRTAYASYGAGDYIDRRWYIHLDRGRYYYLDVTQYLLTGGLGYLQGRFSANPLYGGGALLEKESKPGWETSVPEPSTVAVLSLGCLFFAGFGPRGRARR